ncbi:MAG: penicillin acylase family protein, partial [Cyclobacteriaceae bacterium]|nr:penicillin acylase family protein [Cyclobacteriaceae bacterium]
ISISPKNTKDGKTLFLINPHTSFFFRDEIHVISEDGLDAYGAVTWGQFFVYQGFNENLGWMHTSSRADVIDIYKETILDSASKYYYKYDDETREVKQKTLKIQYKTESGIAEKEFIGYFTHHGPVISKDEDYWYTVSLMNKPVDALTQSYIRTKAKNYNEFYEAMSIRTNSSNNTVYADGDGNIAYFHGNFMPRRNPEFDYSKPLDGSISATDWQGLHEMSETFIIKNPENGWIQNCNSTPFTAAGKFSPKKEDYPVYMAPDKENFRGIHAVKLLEGKSDFTLDGLIKTAYDSYTPGFEHIVPSLISAFETSGKGDEIEEAVDLLKKWDYRWGKSSVETTLAHFWGQRALSEAYNAPNRGEMDPYDFIAKEMEAAMLLSTFQATLDQLNKDFGTWKTPWEDVNRYQRLTGDIRQDFNDDKPSLGVGFVSGRWGSLASFGARTYPGTKKLYGTSGNSFVAFVEFGKKVKAKSITAGGISGDPDSDFFDNQAQMYSDMEFKEVNYYKEDIDRNLLLEYNLRD